MRRWLAAGLALAVGCLATPAEAAGLGFSLPKLRRLAIGPATGWGASVQVIGGAFSVGPARIDLALDYAYARDFGAGANYAFFDAVGGVGLPLQLPYALYMTPALDVHALAFAASPQGLPTPTWGLGPRLTVGYRAQQRLAVELSLSHAFLPAVGGGLSTLELGGTWSF